jgi:hypothetical protein
MTDRKDIEKPRAGPSQVDDFPSWAAAAVNRALAKRSSEWAGSIERERMELMAAQ